MPKRRISFVQGSYYHVYCRGNEKREIFLSDCDYKKFLERLHEFKISSNVSIVCYCLMPNHFHLLLRQNGPISISIFMHRLTGSYSMYFNNRYERVGHVFQGRFKAKLVTDDEYLLHLSRYIHLNPVEIASMKEKVELYQWSSYPEYVGLSEANICDKEIVLKQLGSECDDYYIRFMHSSISQNEISILKRLVIEDLMP